MHTKILLNFWLTLVISQMHFSILKSRLQTSKHLKVMLLGFGTGAAATPTCKHILSLGPEL